MPKTLYITGQFSHFCLLFLLFLIEGSGTAQQIRKTKVLILGTAHLSNIKALNSSSISHLLDSLTTYKFNAIAVEQMPAELLLDIKSRPSELWQELYAGFSTPIETGKRFQKVFGMSYEAAKKYIDSIGDLKSVTQNQRIMCTKARLCMYDSWSALLHYKLIANHSLIDTSAGNFLDKMARSQNEINMIGVQLASKLNIDNLNYVDNFQDEIILMQEFPSFFKDYSTAKTQIDSIISYSDVYSKSEEIKAKCIEKSDLFPYYKFLNSERYLTGDYKTQWELWLKTKFPSKSDRSRYSLWEMRNLQISANIARLIAKYPEKSILVIIGVSHKAFIEKYLRQMPDVEILTFK